MTVLLLAALAIVGAVQIADFQTPTFKLPNTRAGLLNAEKYVANNIAKDSSVADSSLNQALAHIAAFDSQWAPHGAKLDDTNTRLKNVNEHVDERTNQIVAGVNAKIDALDQEASASDPFKMPEFDPTKFTPLAK